MKGDHSLLPTSRFAIDRCGFNSGRKAIALSASVGDDDGELVVCDG